MSIASPSGASHPRIGIVLIGDELLDGRIFDTNARYLAQLLLGSGAVVSATASCGDDIPSIGAALTYISAQSDLVITSGGLGPTTDDLTRQGVATHFKVTTVEHPAALQQLTERLAARGRTMNFANRRQTQIPLGATVIENRYGTAPCFVTEQPGSPPVISLPGVPREFEPLITEFVIPFLLERFPTQPDPIRLQVTVYGLPESEIGERIESLKLTPKLKVAYQPRFPEVYVLCRGDGEGATEGEIFNSIQQVLESEFVIGHGLGATLPLIVHEQLLQSGKTVAVAESCTGGMLGMFLTQSPRASTYFKGGIIAYSNDLKERLLHVPRTILDQHGAVSHECVRSMATGARSQTGAEYALSISGIAGPDGGSEDKPVGTVYIGLATPNQIWSGHFHYPGDRAMIQRAAAFAALDVIRREISALAQRIRS